jgi:hypothetical protein
MKNTQHKYLKPIMNPYPVMNQSSPVDKFNYAGTINKNVISLHKDFINVYWVLGGLVLAVFILLVERVIYWWDRSKIKRITGHTYDCTRVLVEASPPPYV